MIIALNESLAGFSQNFLFMITCNIAYYNMAIHSPLSHSLTFIYQCNSGRLTYSIYT